MSGAVRVMQCDRQRAVDLMEGSLPPSLLRAMLQGKGDNRPEIQAIARHREAETERCARIAETCEIKGPLAVGWADGASAASRQIATAIRASGGEGGR